MGFGHDKRSRARQPPQTGRLEDNHIFSFLGVELHRCLENVVLKDSTRSDSYIL
jgi:hypothetical protein